MMSRIKWVLLSILLGYVSLQAQIPTMPLSIEDVDSIDRVQYRAVYRLSFVSNVEDRDRITQDIIRLDIGDKVIKEYSQLLYQADSLSKSAREAGRMPRMVLEIVPPMVLYKGYPSEGKLTIDYRLPSKAPVMSYVEDIPSHQWSIKSDKKEILGYSCQMAEVDFGGRSWIAWFTQDIPLSVGPYKFGGLPGLILELEDTQGDYHYECMGISNLLGSEASVRWKWNQRSTSKEALEKIIRQLYANPEQALKALGARTHFAGDAMLDLPYNPIER